MISFNNKVKKFYICIYIIYIKIYNTYIYKLNKRKSQYPRPTQLCKSRNRKNRKQNRRYLGQISKLNQTRRPPNDPTVNYNKITI